MNHDDSYRRFVVQGITGHRNRVSDHYQRTGQWESESSDWSWMPILGAGAPILVHGSQLTIPCRLVPKILRVMIGRVPGGSWGMNSRAKRVNSKRGILKAGVWSVSWTGAWEGVESNKRTEGTSAQIEDCEVFRVCDINYEETVRNSIIYEWQYGFFWCNWGPGLRFLRWFHRVTVKQSPMTLL